ncbi:MAG TPA: fluoride efflux transporter CrcB [Chitinophagaceae bacterium]
MIKNILLVGLGGGLGSMARYLSQRWAYAIYPHHFPWGTFAVNIVGCLLIGIFWGISFRSFESNENWKLFLMVGLCGGFTTFSAFTLEGIGLIREQRLALFFSYVAASVLLGLLATYIGMRITR